MLQSDLLLRESELVDGLLQSLFLGSPADPEIAVFALSFGGRRVVDRDEVSGDPMSPPQLARNAPIADVV